jgi:hypothetical protein
MPIHSSKFWILVGVSALAGCGDGAGSGGISESGAVPRISDLDFSPDVVEVGHLTRFSGHVVVRDRDADVIEVGFRIARPNGKFDPEVIATAHGVSGQTDVEVDLSAELTAVEAGVHGVEVWFRDRAGHESNHLTAIVIAEGEENLCVPGIQIECPCGSGRSGFQACNYDGKGYKACVCGVTDGG